jgi:lipid A 4'-phosphatase
MRAILYVILAALVSAAVFLAFPRIDNIVARQFIVDGVFWLRGNPTAETINQIVPLLVYVASGLLLLLIVCRLLGRPIAGIGLRISAFLSLSLLVGPGLIVNVWLKPFSGRPRPHQTTRFDGDLRFERAFDFGGACPGNCSFVSGDAAVAFSLLAVALIVPRGRTAAILAALAFGVAISVLRMVQGAHFLSDVVFAAYFTIIPILILHYVLIERSWPRMPAPRWPVRDSPKG